MGTGDIQPDVGIIGTPVIDSVSNTLYVVSKSKNTGTNCTPATSCHQRLHALSLIDGSEKFGGPVNITSAISVPGTGDGASGGNVAFNTLRQNQRPGLVLANGVVYVAWASHGDNTPYHGWVIGYDKTTLQLVGMFNANPNGSDSGIWMGGGAPAADAAGNLYFLTGNGTFDVNSGGADYGDSTVKTEHDGAIFRGGIFHACGPTESGRRRHGSWIWRRGDSGGPAADGAAPAFDDWRRKRRQLLFAGPRQHGRVWSEFQSGGFKRGAKILGGERDIFYGGVL